VPVSELGQGHLASGGVLDHRDSCVGGTGLGSAAAPGWAENNSFATPPGWAENSRMRGRLGKILDGAGWSVGLAAALFAFALLFLALDFQSPDIVLWTGQRAVGTEQNGLVTFYWKHHAYTATTPGSGSAKAVSVYFPPGNPDAAIAESIPDRLTAVALFAVPVAAGVVVLAVGLTRKRRWARRQSRESASQFGGGLDEDFVARRLQERRGSHQDRQ
jgi:hypothetical protein